MHAKTQQTHQLALVAALLGTLFTTQNALAASPPCRALTHDGSTYTVCEVDLQRYTIQAFWKRADGAPHAYLNALPHTLEKRAGRLIFATNAGMFDEAYKPVGLYVENGRQLVGANTKSGWGNFHMKPNGIFYVVGDKAGVLETGAYLRQRLRPDMATQSGPMLVINGRLHPRFARTSTSLKRRSGVGGCEGQLVKFAISDGEVSFETFARRRA
jgi:uncharacterized protein YigE (DUF2233 family)